MATKNLIVVCGLQGTGKTTIARIISERMHAVLLRTDVIRKELGISQYTEESKQVVYDDMFSRTQILLRENKNVVLDATFTRQKNRDQARQIAKDVNADFQIILVVSSDEMVKRRMEERVGDESEAGFEQYLDSKGSFEAVTENHITIHNSGSIEETLEQVSKYF